MGDHTNRWTQMCPYASHTCKHRHLHIAVAFRASVASLPLLTMWPDDWVIVGLFCSRNLLCILRQLYRLWARSHTGLHIPGLKLIFGHPEWREMRGALYWMSANSNSPDNAASFVGVKRPFHQVGRMEGIMVLLPFFNTMTSCRGFGRSKDNNTYFIWGFV